LDTTTRPAARASRGPSQIVDRGVLWLATHWLALINLFWALYVGLPVLAPLFMEAGWTTPARAIYFLYRAACHQRPDRSYFIGGERAVYTPAELTAAGVDASPLARAIGNAAAGWKVAFCERDVAMYGSLFAGGLIYALIRRRFGKWRLPLWGYALFLAPLVVDGTLQLVGVYESTWVLRTITGILFGIGSVLFAYPYLEEGFGSVRRDLERRLGAGQTTREA
jgi:uncharacterized membrane protein